MTKLKEGKQTTFIEKLTSEDCGKTRLLSFTQYEDYNNESDSHDGADNVHPTNVWSVNKRVNELRLSSMASLMIRLLVQLHKDLMIQIASLCSKLPAVIVQEYKQC